MQQYISRHQVWFQFSHNARGAGDPQRVQLSAHCAALQQAMTLSNDLSIDLTCGHGDARSSMNVCAFRVR